MLESTTACSSCATLITLPSPPVLRSWLLTVGVNGGVGPSENWTCESVSQGPGSGSFGAATPAAKQLLRRLPSRGVRLPRGVTADATTSNVPRWIDGSSLSRSGMLDAYRGRVCGWRAAREGRRLPVAAVVASFRSACM
eukprot:6239179-Prymnesium_polylepis.1